MRYYEALYEYATLEEVTLTLIIGVYYLLAAYLISFIPENHKWHKTCSIVLLGLPFLLPVISIPILIFVQVCNKILS